MMRKLTEQQQQEIDILENNYFVPRAQIKKEHATWKKITFLSLGTSVVLCFLGLGCALYGMTIAEESKKVETIIYQDDGNGGLTIMKTLKPSANFKVSDDKMASYIRNQLSEYVRSLYSVTNSKDMGQENVYKVLYMTQKKYYDQVPRAIFKASYTDNTAVTTVSVSTATQVSKSVWQVNWTKKINGDEVGKFKTWITFKQEDINDTYIASYNPLGIVVTNVDTQADL